jgi:hypothetical protein
MVFPYVSIAEILPLALCREEAGQFCLEEYILFVQNNPKKY